MGHPVYTYDYPDRDVFIGILGWFGVANSQSSILTLLVPPLLLWGLRSRQLWKFCLCCLFGFGLLYFTGTRLTYYGAILIALAFLALLVFRRQQLLFCIPLCVALIAVIACRGISPMAERQALTADSYAIYQEKADEIMGEDKDFVYKKGEEIPPEILEKITKCIQMCTVSLASMERLIGGSDRRVWAGSGDGAVRLCHRSSDALHPE